VVEKKISELNLSQSVLIFGFVPEDNVSSASVFPSLYEGFGYPVLESFASGVPLVASHSSSIREVAGDGALLFDPLDDRQIEESLWEILHDPELQLKQIQAGHSRLKEFSLRKEAESTRNLYLEVIGTSGDDSRKSSDHIFEQGLSR
jgi:glycosyltransferase involved in cell wall biosynthesis